QKRRQTLTLVEFVNEQGQRFYTWQWRTLSELDIRSRHLLFQLVPSTPRIEGTEYGLLHTPRATMIEEPNENFIKRMGDRTDKCYPHLSAQVTDYVKIGLLATPTANPPADITPEIGGTSQLNHRFVLEMMGYPPTWCDLPSEELGMQSYRKSRSKSSKQLNK